VVILKGLPKISGRGGEGALDGPGSEEVVSPSVWGSRATHFDERATLSLARARCVTGGTPGAVDALALVGAAGAAPMVSGLPPTLGGSVVKGAGAAPAVGGASADARFSSSPAARDGVAGVVVNAGSGPGVV
jgi:hypothetical protein